MSLHSIVSEGLAERFHNRRAVAAVARPATAQLAARLSGMSMRLLETCLALGAIGAAVLIGLAR